MRSLLDSKSMWSSDPQKAFEAFIKTPEFQDLGKGRRRDKLPVGAPLSPPMPLRDSSFKVYASMFAKYLRWLHKERKSIFDVTSADLRYFLQRKAEIHGVEQDYDELNSRIKNKYLSILKRVYIHLQLQENPTNFGSNYSDEKGDKLPVSLPIGRDAGMTVLTDAQQQAFLASLPVPTAPHQAWQRRRDRALQALMLGAGLKVSEAIGIYSENIGEKDSTGSITITIWPAAADGTVPWHKTRLRPFAVPEVLLWIVERRDHLKIPGKLLFPATLDGQKKLNPATVYRQVRATFKRAGIDVLRVGGRTLRNSYAVRELGGGESIDDVKEFLGHRRLRSTEYYLPPGPRVKKSE